MGEYPIYLPADHPYTAKLVFQAHLTTLHGGVSLTMAKMRYEERGTQYLSRIFAIVRLTPPCRVVR